MNTNTVSNRDVVRSITDNPSAHYEAFLRYLQSTQPTTALVPSSIALSVPSTSGIIVTSSAATSGTFINYYFLICVCIIYMCKSIFSNMCMHILSIASKLYFYF
ncbi:uncharacterized protein LOC105844956 [Hydra vulgaris]|uniref:uncharacterized protein LOC105844956 n=1 Tax=Hydra vulgaris TaxID=6087 RepID=UPI001F5ECA47|nr:uncharacterized protein LOC105844956 isoform X2 [Hydra vulgaris]